MTNGWPEQAARISLAFDWMCSCGNNDLQKFVVMYFDVKATLLCTKCERKFEVGVCFKEIP